MSGGRLVVLDRLGRDAKAYSLAEGSASIGSDPSCDIRVLLPGVRPHHATVAVHANRTLVRAVDGETRLNGALVSVAPLRHGDALQLAGRALRWDYDHPPPAAATPAAATPCLAVPRRGAAARARRRSEHTRRALHTHTRDSAPASTSTGGKQVAIVQPQRRDASERNGEPSSGSPAGPPATPPASARKSFPSKSPKPLPPDDPTKASLWIESRKPRASPQLLVQSARNSPRSGSKLTTTESPRKKISNVVIGTPKTLSPILRASDICRERASPRDVSPSPSPLSPRLSPGPPPLSPGVSPGPSPAPSRVSLRGVARSAPLRLAVLKKAHSAQSRVTKIRAPLKIDHTKQAAIMLMTGHAARPRSLGPPVRAPARASSAAWTPARAPPARASSAAWTPARGPRASSAAWTPARAPPARASPAALTPARAPPARASPAALTPARAPPARASPAALTPARAPPARASPAALTPARAPPARASPAPRGRARRPPSRASGPARASLLGSPLQITQDVTESDIQTPVGGRRSSRQTLQSPALTSPKKSALKDPTAKKNTRKSESIKFDLSNLSTLSNLESYSSDCIASDVILAESSEGLQDDMTDEDITLHYSDNSSSKSPSPMKTIHSRSSLIIEKSLGSPMQTPTFEKSTLNVHSPRSKRSLRGTIIVQKALNNSDSRYSRRTTKSLSDQSYSTTITSRISETLSQRSSQNLEAYSIVDLVSVNSNESGRSVYNSLASNSTVSFGTPGTIRRTRSKNSSLLGSSTPYSKKNVSLKASDSSETTNQRASQKSRISTRSASITTPENIKTISFNSTKTSRPSRTRSRLNESDVLLVDEDKNEEISPRSSRRTSKNLLSPIVRKNISIPVSPDNDTNGTVTPENMCSPQNIGTPMLSIQNLLDQSYVSQTSKPSQNSRNTRSNVTRRTIGSTFVEPKRSRLSVKSRSLNLTQRRSLRARRAPSDSLNAKDQSQDTDDAVTPKSAVKLVQEAVKNKHSTAKKPQSKRSLIDNLDDCDFVKELFNSPVKRKLSQSMTEFSRKFFDDDVIRPSRPTRNTVALTGRTPDTSLLNNTQEFTPEMFVSPLSTLSNSPNLSGLKRILRKNTPENDLRNVSGVKTLLRTPRARKSINNDLSNISGVKKLFGRSPRNRLSDVRVKEVFALSPTADFRQVAGVKALFQKSPLNDLRNISGVKRALRANSPRNNLSDVRGVKRLFREQYNENNSSDVSGVEELRDESPGRDATFDRLLGRPRLRAYTKSNSCGGVAPSKKGKGRRGATSLHDSIGLITDNVEEWLQNELKKRVQRPVLESDASKSISRSNVTRELQKLHTDTVEGHTPSGSRADDGRKMSASEIYSARKLPLKKRSLASPRRSRDAALPLKKRALPQSVPHSTRQSGAHSALQSGAQSALQSAAHSTLQSAPHSTPLRPTARGLSMNASELSRVSPIAAVVAPGILLPPPQSPKPRAARGRKPKKVIDDAEVIVVVNPSPKRTRGRVMRSSPTRVRALATRGRKTNDIKSAITHESGSSVVIAKKPVMSPKQSPKITRMRKVLNISNDENGSKKIRSARRKSQIKVTPKTTRAKVLKDTVVVLKPSPQIKPRSKRQIKERADSNQTEKVKKTRNATINHNNLKEAKTRKTKEIPEEQQTEQIVPLKPKRGRKIAVIIEAISVEEIPVKKRGRKAQEVQNVSETQDKRTRKVPERKKTKLIEPEPYKTSRAKKENVGQRKVAIVETSPLKLIKTKTIDKVIRKSKRGAKDIEDKKNTSNTKKTMEKPVKKTRASKKSVAESVEVEPKTDGRKSRKTVAKEETKSAKTKKPTPARALRKRPALDPVEDTTVETKKRRTRRAVV